MNLQELQILAQLADNLDVASQKLKQAHSKNNLEEFNKSKLEINTIQQKISEMLGGSFK